MKAMRLDRLRTSETMDFEPIHLEFCEESRLFYVSTWRVLYAKFTELTEAIKFFEVLEFVECSHELGYRDIARAIKLEIKRQVRLTGSAHGKIMAVVDGAEKRLAGLIPRACGSKSSCVEWMPIK